jgi:hypothetical protein
VEHALSFEDAPVVTRERRQVGKSEDEVFAGAIIKGNMVGRLTEELRKATRQYGRLHPVDAGRDADDTEHGAHAPFGWVSLLLLAVVILGSWLVICELQADSKMEDCVWSGRKNCAPVDTDSMRRAPTQP